jgi:hypothetical protein
MTFPSTIRQFADNDKNNLKVGCGSIGVFRNKYGNLFVGEVSEVNRTTRSYTVVEYVLLDGYNQEVTRFKAIQDPTTQRNIYHTCIKGVGENLVVKKLSTTCIINDGEGQFVEMLDLSRKCGDGKFLINSGEHYLIKSIIIN